MSEPEAEADDEVLLPIEEAPAADPEVPPEELPDDWLDQKPFDPAGR